MADPSDIFSEELRRGSVLHASHDGVHCLRFVGDIRFPLAASVNTFFDSLMRAGTPKGFVVDLDETQAIDSTMLGVVARIANRMRKDGGPRVTIICSRDDIAELLESVGFDEVFDIVREQSAEPRAGEMLPLQEPDGASLARTVIEAHRTLMSLNEHNRELFRDLVAALEADQANTPSAEAGK